MELLDKYGHANTNEGVGVIADRNLRAKAKIIERLRKHPHWDEEQNAIILKSDYSRDFDRSKIAIFSSWIMSLREVAMESCNANAERGRMTERYHKGREQYRALKRVVMPDNYDGLLRLGELYTENIEISAWLDDIQINDNRWYDGYYLGDEYDKLMQYSFLIKVIDSVADEQSQLVTETTCAVVKNAFPNINCVVGQKCSKVVNAICRSMKIDAKLDYNAKFAQFADGCNPLHYETYTVISVNLLDYLTMSFGKNWASCHTIDIHNIRFGNGECHYHGMYCAGCLSYAVDRVSIILYTVDRAYDNPSEMWKADKIRRNMFYLDPDNGSILVQSRVYPDGRDGGETGIATQFRAIMQDIVATCWEIPNNWTLKKGTAHTGDYAIRDNDAVCYSDWTCYNDCSISFNKEFDSYERIVVGAAPICPVCGCEHTREDHLVCGDCDEDSNWIECDWCGHRFDPESDDHVYDEYGDRDYCCPRCAERNGCYHVLDCYDDYCWTSNPDIFWDDFAEEYYYDDDCEVTCEDGCQYRSEYNAEHAGYVQARNEDGYWVWVHEEETYGHFDGDLYTYEEEEEEEIPYEEVV